MREILFRAKAINRDPNREYRTDYKNGDWVYGLIEKLPFYDENGEKFFEKDCAHMRNTSGVSDIDVDENTICEYTGLKDKNGIKIFEDDIVKAHYIKKVNATPYESDFVIKEEFEAIGKVVYDGGCFIVKWINLFEPLEFNSEPVDKYVNGASSIEYSFLKEYKYKFTLGELKVIGNVFDNPELVKGENNGKS